MEAIRQGGIGELQFRYSNSGIEVQVIVWLGNGVSYRQIVMRPRVPLRREGAGPCEKPCAFSQGCAHSVESTSSGCAHSVESVVS